MDPSIQELRENTPWGELLLRIRPGSRPRATLRLEGVLLMDSESGKSERALAERGLAALREVRRDVRSSGVPPRSLHDRRGPADRSAPPSLRVLLGGLGLGFTLRAVLEDRGVGLVQVVELLPSLIGWNRSHPHLAGGPTMDDPRVRCRAADLVEFLERHSRREGTIDDRFDLLLLDIDNGPTRLSVPSNARIYTPAGLALLRRWMAPCAVAVFWAAEPSLAFEESLASMLGAEWRREEVGWHTGRGDREMKDVLYYLIGGGPHLPGAGTRATAVTGRGTGL